MCSLKKLFKKLYLVKVCSTEFFAICGSDLAKIELTVHAKTQKGLHFLISALDVVTDLNRVNANSQERRRKKRQQRGEGGQFLFLDYY